MRELLALYVGEINYSLSTVRRRCAGGAWYITRISTHQASPVNATLAAVNYTIWGIQT